MTLLDGPEMPAGKVGGATPRSLRIVDRAVGPQSAARATPRLLYGLQYNGLPCVGENEVHPPASQR